MSKLVINNKKLENVKLVIFDKDGTIIDVHHYWCSMIKMRSDFLAKKYCSGNKDIYYNLIDKMGIDINSNKMKPEGPVGIKSRKFIITTAFNTLKKYHVNVVERDVSETFKEVDIYSQTIIKKLINPLIGIPNLLLRLIKNNIKIAIATTDMTHRAELAMSALGIKDLFKNITGADIVLNAKPASDLVDHITTELGFKHQNVIIVGDAMVDLQMAKNSNCRFVGVKTGLFNNKFLKETKFLIDNLNKIEVTK